MPNRSTLKAQNINTTSHDGAHEALWWLDFHTTKGRKAENQDSLLVTTCLPYRRLSATINETDRYHHAPLLVLMADGVSACQFPKQASQLVVNTVAHHLNLALENLYLETSAESECHNKVQTSPMPALRSADHDIASLIKMAVNKANDALYFPQVYQRMPPLLSTLSGLLCIGDRIHLFHTGDSRIYRINRDSLTVLSKDHRIHRGQDKGALSAAIGADMYIELQQSVFTLHQEECLALMTDGVYESINAAELEFELCTEARALCTSMETSKPAADISISRSLCEQAFNEGSHDNLSMMILGINTQLLHKQKTGDSDHTNDNSNNAHAGLHDIYRYQLLTDLEVGARIDGFIVVEIIARTARSEVYLVEDEHKRMFVIKSPSLNAVADGHYLREFLKERSIGLSLSKHKRAGESAYNQADPNTLADAHSPSRAKTYQGKNLAISMSGLLRYYPVPASSHYLYHLTEYIKGENLREFITRQAPCDVWQTYDLLTKIGMAVRVMHRHYLLHQDIKPENILISADGAIKLIDFGSASSSILKDSTRPPNGDLHYAAPEYYTNAPKGVHSDLFSVAVIGYELLTGTRPFSSQALMNATQTLVLPTKLLSKRRVPAASQQALLRALHPNTQARYQAIGEFLQDFNPDNASNISDPEPLIVRHPLLVWHSICFIQFVLILSLLAYFT